MLNVVVQNFIEFKYRLKCIFLTFLTKTSCGYVFLNSFSETHIHSCFCLFVCLRFFVSLEQLSLIWNRPVLFTRCQAFGCGSVINCFYDLGVAAGIRNPTFHMRDKRYNPLSHRHGVRSVLFSTFYLDIFSEKKSLN